MNLRDALTGSTLLLGVALAGAQDLPPVKSGSVVPIVQADPHSGFPPSLKGRALSGDIHQYWNIFTGFATDKSDSFGYGGVSYWKLDRFKYNLGILFGTDVASHSYPVGLAFAEGLVALGADTSDSPFLDLQASTWISGSDRGTDYGLQLYKRFWSWAEKKSEKSSGRFMGPEELWLNGGVRELELPGVSSKVSVYSLGVRATTKSYHPSANSDLPEQPKFTYGLSKSLGGSDYELDEWSGSITYVFPSGLRSLTASYTSRSRFNIVYSFSFNK